MAAFFGDGVKTALLKGIEALGKGAAELAQGAHKKLDEMKLENRRRDVLTEIPKCVNELYAQGIELPEELTKLLDELADLDAQLAAMKPAPAPEPEKPEAQEEAPVEEVAAAEEVTVEEVETAEEAPEETSEETTEEAE